MIRIIDFLRRRRSVRSESGRLPDILRLARSLHEQGEFGQAATTYASILEVDPDHWEALNSLASIAFQKKDFYKALELYDHAIRRRRDHVEAFYRRANVLNRLSRWDEALADYDRAIELDPRHANAHCNRGVVLECLERWDAALASYDRSVEVNPVDFLSFYNRASVHRRCGRFSEALNDYDRAIALNSDYAEAYINRGNVLQALLRDEAAIASYDRGIELNPQYAEAFQGRGSSLFSLGRFDAAIASFDRCIALQPDQKFVLGMRRHAKMMLCDWRDLATDLKLLADGLQAGKAVSAPFPLLSLVDSASLQLKAAQIWIRDQCPHGASPTPAAARVPGDKIHVGYFSADFRIHAVSQLAVVLFESHDRSEFEITAFAFGPAAADQMRARLQLAFDRFIDVTDLSDVDVATVARDLKIDIAVDLAGFTQHSRPRIFARRAAPLQVAYLGYPGTMGADFIDYLIADRTLVPNEQQCYYTEKIVYLPNCFLPHDSSRVVAEETFTRETFALPDAGFVFCCFNNAYKITPATFDSWMRILCRTPSSVLWLSRNNPATATALQLEASQRGIDPKRLIFADRMTSAAEHLARHKLADLFLDTLPYGAHATAVDALWAELPVLTLMGGTFAGRVAASMLKALDLPELVTTTAAQYENLAVELASNPRRLAEIKRKLERNRVSAPLFDSARLTHNLECAYRTMFDRYHTGLLPDHIYLEERAVLQP